MACKLPHEVLENLISRLRWELRGIFCRESCGGAMRRLGPPVVSLLLQGKFQSHEGVDIGSNAVDQDPPFEPAKAIISSACTV